MSDPASTSRVTTFSPSLESSHSTEEAPILGTMAPGKSIFGLLEGHVEPNQVLLGNRWLCKGGSLLFIGPSGVGKSSASMQQDILWAVGKEAFGIRPARALRIMTIQAENDDEDLREMARGVLKGAELSSPEKALLKKNLLYCTVDSATGEDFLTQLNRRLEEWPCDIVRIDPLFAFFGNKIEDSSSLSLFLRGGLNPILNRHNVGCIIAHHTPKVAGRDTRHWSPSDYSYSGAGGAELTNWARCVLALDGTAIQGTYKWVAAKRGSRIGWTDALGQKEFARYFQHANDESCMFWNEANTTSVQRAFAKDQTKRRSSSHDPEPLIKELVPKKASIEKGQLLDLVRQRGAARQPAQAALERLLAADEPEFFERNEKRRSGRDRKLISRLPPSTSKKSVMTTTL